jgi:hypothetical protein
VINENLGAASTHLALTASISNQFVHMINIVHADIAFKRTVRFKIRPRLEPDLDLRLNLRLDSYKRLNYIGNRRVFLGFGLNSHNDANLRLESSRHLSKKVDQFLARFPRRLVSMHLP